MAKNKRKIWSLFVPLIILIFAVAFISGCAPKEKEEVVKIGAMLILSGEGAAWGQTSQKAIDLAVGETNEKGGINGKKIEVIYEDTQGSAARTIAAYNKLKDIDKVTAIIGPNTQTEVSAIAPIANEDNFPVISPSYTHPENRPDLKNPLMIWIDPSIEAGKMAEYVYNQGIRKISILGTEDGWEKEVSTAFKDKFVSLGGEVKVMELIQPNEKTVHTTVFKAIKDNPDAVFLGTYYQFLNFGRKLKELGYEGRLYSIEVDEYLAKESKEFSSGLQFISPELYKDSFRQKYEEKYGEKSNIPAGQSYDTAKILIMFLKQGESRQEILNMMENFNSYEGVSGDIVITKDNRTVMPMAIYELKKGDIERIKPIN